MSYFTQAILAEASLEDLEARILAKAQQCGVEAVVIQGEITLIGKDADVAEVKAEFDRALGTRTKDL